MTHEQRTPSIPAPPVMPVSKQAETQTASCDESKLIRGADVKDGPSSNTKTNRDAPLKPHLARMGSFKKEAQGNMKKGRRRDE